MYCDFYHLSEKPFNITPDPKFLYLNARYREALATLNYGVTERKGFITLIGEAGTGKTTLLNKLLDQLDEKTKTVLIFNTNVTFEEILEYMFAEFDLPIHSGKKLYMLQRLNAFLLEELRNGGNVAVLIDEAQDLDMTVLENLRLLSNLETAKEKILQIILSGQPELEKKLASPELRQLRQRIAVNCRLTSLSREELSEYIEFRLHAAGCEDPKMFTREAEEQVWHYARGIPRLVNVVCDNALVIGYALGKKRIGADIVREASADLLATQGVDLGLDIKPEELASIEPAVAAAAAPRRSGRWGTWALFGLVLAALVIGFLSMGRRLLPRRTDEVAQPALPGNRLVVHPGQRAEDAPPARLGVDQPAAAARPQAPEPARGEPPVARPAAVEPQSGVAVTDDHARAEAAVAEPQAAAPKPAAPVEPLEAPAQVAARPAVQPPAPRIEEQAEEIEDRPAQLEEQAAHEEDEAEPVEDAEPAPAAAAQPLPLGEDDSGIVISDPAARSAGAPVRLSGAEFDRITVRDGDSFAQIAVRKYGQSSYTILDLLKLANPEVRDIDRISAGQTLDLPRLSQGFSIVEQGGRGYGVLIYSTPVPSRAQALARALRARGFASEVSLGHIAPGRTVQRVIIGPFADPAGAAGASKDVQRAFREDEKLAALGRS